MRATGPNAAALVNNIHDFEGWSCVEDGDPPPPPMTRVDLDVTGRALVSSLSGYSEGADEDRHAPKLSPDHILSELRKVDNTNAFLIHNLLTPEECSRVIRRTKAMQVPMDNLYEQRYRRASRVMFRSERMAADLFKRMIQEEVDELSNWKDQVHQDEDNEDEPPYTIGCTKPVSALRHLQGLPSDEDNYKDYRGWRANYRREVPVGPEHLIPTKAPSALQKRDYEGRIPLCFGHGGVWVPIGVNECFKVFQYGRGGEFVEHRDGPWVPRDDQCSMYTVVIYLNSSGKVLPEGSANVLEGGATVLMGSCDDLMPVGSRCRWGWDRGLSVPPTAGTGLVFNHDCWHAADEVKSDEPKYTLRTEIIFQRIHSFYVDRYRFADDAQYKATRALYDSSQRALASGDRGAFAEQYQQVVEMQRNAMLRECERSPKRILFRLSHDEVALVLMYVADDGLMSLLTANSSTFRFLAHSPAWRAKLQACLGIADVGRGCTVYDDDMTKYAQFRMSNSKHGGFLPSALLLAETGSLIVDPVGRPAQVRGDVYDSDTGGRPEVSGMDAPDYWKECRPVRAVSKGASPVEAPLEPAHYPGNHVDEEPQRSICYVRDEKAFSWALDPAWRDPALQPRGVIVNDDLPRQSYRLLRCSKYFGEWMYTYPLHMNAPSGERYEIGDQVDTPVSMVHGCAGHVWWDVLSVPVEVRLNASRVPLMIIAHPMWAQVDAKRDDPVPLSSADTLLGMRHMGTSKFECPDDMSTVQMGYPLFVKKNVGLLWHGVFETLRSPALCVCHPAICAVLGHARSGGSVSSYATDAGGPGEMAVALLYGSRPYMCYVEVREASAEFDTMHDGLSCWIDGVLIRVRRTVIGLTYDQLLRVADADVPAVIQEVHREYCSDVARVVSRELTVKMPELRSSDACNLGDKANRTRVAAARTWCGAEMAASSHDEGMSTAEFPVLVAIDDTKPFGLPSDVFVGIEGLFEGFGCVRSLPVMVGIGSSVYMNQPGFREMCAFRFGDQTVMESPRRRRCRCPCRSATVERCPICSCLQ